MGNIDWALVWAAVGAIWAGVAAIAQCFEAVAVILGLGFAYSQVNQWRGESAARAHGALVWLLGFLGPDQFQARLATYRNVVDQGQEFFEDLKRSGLSGLLADLDLIAWLAQIGLVTDEMIFQVSGPSIAALANDVGVYRTTKEKPVREWLEAQIKFRQRGHDLLMRIHGLMEDARKEAGDHARQVVDALPEE